MSTNEIPYEEIDVEIRPLIKLMNLMPGIETIFSCVGHTDDNGFSNLGHLQIMGYVLFRAETIENLRDLLLAMKLEGEDQAYVTAVYNCPVFYHCEVKSTLRYGELVHRLSICGSPVWAQRRLIEKFEKSLKEYFSKGQTQNASHAD